MQTRRRAQQQEFATAASLLPHLPTAVQLFILDKAVATFPAPDSEDYAAVYPYKSSLGWLLSLRKVCSAWDEHLQQQAVLRRRIRLEKLRNLSLLHDYAYYITTINLSKQTRIKRVPRSICLSFADSSSSTLDVPKGGVAGANKPDRRRGTSGSSAATSGLPTHALMLLCWSADISTSALLELLADLDALDKQHAAPIILQVRNSSTGTFWLRNVEERKLLDGDGLEEQGRPVPGSYRALKAGFAALEAAALPAVTGVLKDVVQERGGLSESEALTFIPTSKGFCRRVPLAGA
jgi:hypothetical protein